MATTQQDVIKKFMASLDTTTKSGTAALNEAITACTGSKYTTIQSVIDKMVADCKSTNNATNFLKDYCGIDLTNEDTGAITGLDAGGSKSKNAEDIVPEVGSLQTYASNSFTKNGVTFSLSRNYNSLTAAQKYMWNGLYTWWVDGAFDLIAESYGSNYSLQSGTNMKVEFVNNSNFLAAAPFAAHYNGECYPTGLQISLTYYSNINTSNPNGVSTNYGYQDAYLDRVLAHEFTHSVMAANIKYMNELPQFIAEGMAELTHGIDDERTSTIKNLAGNSTSLKNALNVSDVGTGTESAYAGGYMFLRYLAKQFADSTSTEESVSGPFTEGADYYNNTTANTILSALGGNDTINNKAKYVTINGGAGNDEIGSYLFYSNYSFINGDAGDDWINNDAERVTVNGGTGNDTIQNAKNLGSAGNTAGDYSILNGDAGNDFIYSNSYKITISGGKDQDKISLDSYASNNFIQYASGDGNDTVYGFKNGDTLNVTGAKYSTVKSGNDLIVKVGSGSVLLKNAATLSTANIKGTLEGSSSNIFTEGADYYNNTTANTILSALGGNDEVFNSASNVQIYGNAGNDFLSNANGQSVIGGNNVTLNGGAGNDTLYNNGNNVLLIGGEGNDNIQNIATIGEGTTMNKVTVNGGKGDDFINITPYYAKYARKYNVVQYASGDGNDTVGSFDSYDMLHITSGSISKTSVSGNNFIVYVGDGRITFENFVAPTLTVKLADGTVTTLRAESKTEETALWKISGTTATYGTNSKTLVTVNGINKNATAEDFSLDGTNVTLSANALGTSKVTISNGYTLALASDVATPSETSTSWQILETSAALFSGTSAGYILSDDKKSVTYSKEKTDKILAVVRGINKNATADSFSVKGNTITLSKSVLNKNREITISGDYDLALATDVTKSKTVSAGWSVKNTTATYKTAGVSEGYVLSDDKKTVSYTSKTKSKTAVTLKGLKSGLKSSNGKISGITLNNKNVKLATKVLGKEGASVSGGGYTFTLGGKGLLKNIGAAATFKGSSKNDTLIGGNGNDSILGGAGNDSLTGGNGNDTLSGGNGNDSIFGNAGNDKLLGGAGNDTLTGGKGNDTLTGGKGKDIFVYTKSTGNDIITDYTAGTDKIKISSGSISKVTYNKKDVIFKIGNGTLTVKNGKGKKIFIIDSKGKTSTKTYSGSKNSNTSELWFAEENNFVSTDNLDSITKNNLTPTALEKITTTNYENLTQDNLITFTDK